MVFEGKWRVLMGNELADIGRMIEIGSDGAASTVHGDRQILGWYRVIEDIVRIGFDWSDAQGSYSECITATWTGPDRLSATVTSTTTLIDDDEPFAFSDPATLVRVAS